MATLSPTTLIKTVATAGDAEKLTAASVLCVQAIIQALEDNTGRAGIGDSAVDAGAAVNRGVLLDQGELLSLTARDGFMYDLTEHYIDVLNDADGVAITYWA